MLLRFNEVATSATKVGEIAAASNEQAQGIEQVNKAVAEMDKVTQQATANAGEPASEEMNAQAEQIRGLLMSSWPKRAKTRKERVRGVVYDKNTT